MLDIRPNCEHCDKHLAPDATDAMICSYECTFCADCVESVLENVCPNCGGGFVSRPVRPATEWRTGVSCAHQKPSEKRVLKPVDKHAHKAFAQTIKTIPPQKR
ncbi:DUF1272 domain-containing protein [Kordiimonas lipolytica]|uniref:DUF1272 domain-containing protein n=1 Tax=Kordiimonas lipolytica TaxID=1662421 RepID=A0ABV8UE65_9PROT|nr:DUF1272 domain-containing protein [Kordiimonas lipolytica]